MLIFFSNREEEFAEISLFSEARETMIALCNVVCGLLLYWSAFFTALHTALLAKFKIFLLAGQDGFGCLAAQVALLSATGFFTQLGDEITTFMCVFKVECHTVGSH
jgi:hypothetical protein